MRIEIAFLVGSCVALAGGSVWGQVPVSPLPGGPAAPGTNSPAAPASNSPAPVGPGGTAPAGSVAPPPSGTAPLAPSVPPPALVPFDPAQSPPFGPPTLPPPTRTATPAPSSAEPSPEKPLQLAGRFGFGFGIWAAPAGLLGNAGVGAAAGGSLGVRWWASERILLVPSLRMGISYTSKPDEHPYYQDPYRGATFTDGHFSPGLSLGVAAYRGKSSRFILMGGVAFSYTVSHSLTPTLLANNSVVYQYVPVETVSLDVPAGFAFEQFFTPKLSISLGAGAPLFSYGHTRTGHSAPSTFVGADFSTAQINGSVFFYTD